MDPSLLQPSLTEQQPRRPLYSSNACWVSAFFGGTLAAAIMFGLNAWRAGRLRVDAPWIIGGVLVAVLALVLWSRLIAPELISADIYRLANRALALALAGLWHWRLRPSMRAQELTGSAHPRAWLPAIGSILIGAIASAMLANQLGLLRR